MIYTLLLDTTLSRFLDEGFTWEKKTTTKPYRGLANDPHEATDPHPQSKIQKNTTLDLLLGQIANLCPVISRNSIVKGSTSVNDIWHKIRQQYGFQTSGAHFLDLASIRLQQEGRSEDLFQCLCAFYEDNLLTTTSDIKHHGDKISADEDLTPTLENKIVLKWLALIHPGLPQLVKQKYRAELRYQTLASIKPEISQALSSLLDELQTTEETRALRTKIQTSRFSGPNTSWQFPKKSCALCKAAKRAWHSLAAKLPIPTRRGQTLLCQGSITGRFWRGKQSTGRGRWT